MKRLTAILLVLVMMVSFAGVASADSSSGDLLVYLGLSAVTSEYSETLYDRLLYFAGKASPTETDLWMAMGAAWAHFQLAALNTLESAVVLNMDLSMPKVVAGVSAGMSDYIGVDLVEKYQSGDATISEIIDELLDLVAPYYEDVANRKVQAGID